jgi:hypothetical protein
MNYTDYFNQLKQATLFDLYRLSKAIEQAMQDPKRLSALRQQLHIGMRAAYFCSQKNGDVEAIITSLGPKRVHVREILSGEIFTMPYYMLNVSGVDTMIHESSEKLTAQSLQVGERVGFRNRQGKDLVGKIERLNSKTVTLYVPSTNGRWRVSYQNLYRVYDTELANHLHIGSTTYDGELTNDE